MKSIAIIGAGIAGLRAGLELSKIHEVTIYEKSPSVGGRVASRRFSTDVVNHGAESFDGLDYLSHDPLLKKFHDDFDFSAAATRLPKAMRDFFLESSHSSILFNTKISRINDQGHVRSEQGNEIPYDSIIITAPLPQVRELLGENILPDITYSKQILFIGIENVKPIRLELPLELSESLFDLDELFIRKKSEELFFRSVENLTITKWRYSRISSGSLDPYYVYNPKIIIAGDAFDPGGNHHLGAAWISGQMAARRIL